MTIYLYALEKGIDERIRYESLIFSLSSRPISLKIAPSVGLPRTSLSFDQLTVELSAPINCSSSLLPSKWKSTTLILFWVSVPVLSVKMILTAPIVSQACIFLTKLFSFAIVFMENAKARVTERGSPSGTATMMTITAPMRNFTSVRSVSADHAKVCSPNAKSQCTRLRMINIREAIVKAAILIRAARPFSCSCSGVIFSTSIEACRVVFPISVSSPTFSTTPSPVPCSMVVPRRSRLGAKPEPWYSLSMGYLGTARDSPVMVASETIISMA